MSKVIIVTGASRGIGRNIAYNLAVNGYRVIANYNNSEEEDKKDISLLFARNPRHKRLMRADRQSKRLLMPSE